MEEFYRIYKSQFRGLIEGDKRRSFFTFNEGNYQNESRNAIESLRQFSEHYLIEKRLLELNTVSDSLILIPIEGALEVTGERTVQSISPQEMLLISPKQYQTIGNHSATEMSRFYLIRLAETPLQSTHSMFNLEPGNKLVSLLEIPEVSLEMGVFSGRTDSEFIIPEAKTAFVTVINGAFEIQNRLLETNDSLLIENASLIEFESLSEHAIILILCF